MIQISDEEKRRVIEESLAIRAALTGTDPASRPAPLRHRIGIGHRHKRCARNQKPVARTLCVGRTCAPKPDFPIVWEAQREEIVRPLAAHHDPESFRFGTRQGRGPAPIFGGAGHGCAKMPRGARRQGRLSALLIHRRYGAATFAPMILNRNHAAPVGKRMSRNSG